MKNQQGMQTLVVSPKLLHLLKQREQKLQWLHLHPQLQKRLTPSQQHLQLHRVKHKHQRLHWIQLQQHQQLQQTLVYQYHCLKLHRVPFQHL